MNAISKVLVAGFVGLVVASESASACGHRCPVRQGNVQAVPQMNNFPQLNDVPQPIPNLPTPGDSGLTQNDSVINDLPADAKRAIKAAAAKGRANVSVRQVSNSRLNSNGRNAR